MSDFDKWTVSDFDKWYDDPSTLSSENTNVLQTVRHIAEAAWNAAKEHKGWTDAPRNVLGSIVDYPHQGGDIEGMPFHERIQQRTYTQAELAAAVQSATEREHANHVQFANDIYATLIDPLEGSFDNEADLFAQCLKAATDQRQALHDATERMPCGHLKADWAEGAHTPHEGDTEHHCQPDCLPDHCRICAEIQTATATALAQQREADASLVNHYPFGRNDEMSESIRKAPLASAPAQEWLERRLVVERNNTLELAATVADKHWPESGHVHQEGAVSCQMSISVDIRNLKKNKDRTALDQQLAAARRPLIVALRGLIQYCSNSDSPCFCNQWKDIENLQHSGACIDAANALAEALEAEAQANNDETV